MTFQYEVTRPSDSITRYEVALCCDVTLLYDVIFFYDVALFYDVILLYDVTFPMTSLFPLWRHFSSMTSLSSITYSISPRDVRNPPIMMSEIPLLWCQKSPYCDVRNPLLWCQKSLYYDVIKLLVLHNYSVYYDVIDCCYYIINPFHMTSLISLLRCYWHFSSPLMALLWRH